MRLPLVTRKPFIRRRVTDNPYIKSRGIDTPLVWILERRVEGGCRIDWVYEDRLEQEVKSRFVSPSDPALLLL